MSAAGGVSGGAGDTGSTVRTSADIGGASGRAATSAWGKTEVVAEAAFAVDAEAGAVESEAEAGAGARRASSLRAKADDPKNTNSMAATATLTSLPRT
jgi:hypothetical protein